MKIRALAVILALALLSVSLISCGTTLEEERTGETVASSPSESTEEENPADDGVLNLLMIGSSYCYYYTEELYDLLIERLPEEYGEVNVYNLYYSGCKLDQHYDWWRSGTGKYQLFRVSARGREKLGGDTWTLEQALAQKPWDFISLQGNLSGKDYVTSDGDALAASSVRLAEPLYDRIHKLHPSARLFWHCTWYREIGSTDPDGSFYPAENAPLYNENMRKVGERVCAELTEKKEYSVTLVDTGKAWTEARARNEEKDVLPYGGLTARLGYNSFGDGRDHAGDGSHDGDIGGGQLLNAYMWYMALTGDTDLATLTYEPSYSYQGKVFTLTKEHIALLKEAAVAAFGSER